MKVFEVMFDGGVDLFRPGDWVQGTVKIVLSEPKKDIRGKLKLKAPIYHACHVTMSVIIHQGLS